MLTHHAGPVNDLGPFKNVAAQTCAGTTYQGKFLRLSLVQRKQILALCFSIAINCRYVVPFATLPLAPQPAPRLAPVR